MSGHYHTSVNQIQVGHQTSVQQTTFQTAKRQPGAPTPDTSVKRPAEEYLVKPKIGLQRKEVTTTSTAITSFLKASRFHASLRSDPRLVPSAITKTENDGSTQGQSLYSQRRAIACTPTPTANPLLSLSNPVYGLPRRLVENFSALGVASIYPWQSSCLLSGTLLRGDGNLVYVAPTGGGKSLVSDVLMIKKIIINPDKKGMLVLPYVALVQEKLRWLRRVVDGVQRVPNANRSQKESMWRNNGNEQGIRIAGLIGGSKTKFSWLDVDIVVCTIEKANALVNAAIEEGTAGDIGVVVMDELHMINDDNRGYILELMAAKLLSLEQNTQIIGMSATLPNADVLAQWLNGKFYISRYKPIPIEEFLVFEGGIYPAATARQFYKTVAQLSEAVTDHIVSQTVKPRPMPCRTIAPSEHAEFKSPLVNAAVALATETARSGYGALVFCSSRKGTETDATIIAQAMPDIHEIAADLMEMRRDLLSELRSCPAGLDPTLEKTVPFGVGFHHAGLTTEERDIVARAYDDGLLKVMVATCSLSAGINLPARRVILHGARMGRDLVAPSMLRQMRGRAGRKGKDEVGETYLCCAVQDLEEVAELMETDLPNVTSCLSPDKRGIERALLEIIATKLATTPDIIADYARKTLLFHFFDIDKLPELIESTLKGLIEQELVTKKTSYGGIEYEPTLLGQAIVAAALTPEDGLFVHRQLSRAIKAFVLDGDMHVLYTFTPIQSTMVDVNWKVFRQEVERLDESGMRVLQLVGIKPGVVNKLAMGGSLAERTPEEIEVARVYKRFYAALQLRDLCSEVPVHAVARKYEIPRGSVQTLAHTCHGFAAGMIKFCERMGWGALAAALDHMSDRLKAGAKADLLALAKVTFIKSRTARIFWDNGFKSVGALANARVEDIMPILLQAQPKKLRLGPEDDEKYQKKLAMKAEVIVKSAGRMWESMVQAELDEGFEGLE